MKLGKAFLIATSVALMLGALASAASAGRLSASNQRLRATFASAEFSGLFGTIRCPVTIEGSFHERTTSKTAGRLVGYITSETLGACSAGTTTILAETLPWHIQYSSFTGTLPNIATMIGNIIGLSFRVRETGGITCLTRTTAGEPARITFNREGGGAITTASMGGAIATGAECFAVRGTLGGTSSSLTTEGGSRLTITLI